MTIVTHDTLDSAARAILKDNDRGGYTVPTSGLYPYQWNWDSAFAAWGFATFDVPRAWTELELLMASQWDNGMVPHIIFHKQVPEYFPGPDVWGVDHTPPTSGITQPPIAATMARAVYNADRVAGRSHMEAMFDPLLRWHRWFMECRVDDGMVAITHPWESGRDNAPDWDTGMAGVDGSGVGDYLRRDTQHVDSDMRPRKQDYDRYLAMLFFSRDCQWNEQRIRAESPFRVADPGMTFLLLRACRDLRDLAVEFDRETQEIDAWIEILEAGAANHWNPDVGYYDSKNLRTGEFTKVLSSASLLNWYAGIADDRMLPMLERMMDVSYPIPSCDPGRRDFDHVRYWRGPTWCIINTLIGIGLAEQGQSDHARSLKERTRAVIAEHGFYEYFSPLDGTPSGGAHFTWTAAIWLTWASPSATEVF